MPYIASQLFLAHLQARPIFELKKSIENSAYGLSKVKTNLDDISDKFSATDSILTSDSI